MGTEQHLLPPLVGILFGNRGGTPRTIVRLWRQRLLLMYTHTQTRKRAQACGSFVRGYVLSGLLTRLESDLTCDCMYVSGIYVRKLLALCIFARCLRGYRALRIVYIVWYAHMEWSSGKIQIEPTGVDRINTALQFPARYRGVCVQQSVCYRSHCFIKM